MLILPNDENTSVITLHRKELSDYLDRKGYCRFPRWLVEYLPLMGQPAEEATLKSMEELLNEVPENDTEVMINNILINSIMLLIRMKKSNIVVL